MLGRKTIQPHSPGILAGSLPYQTVATGARLQALPDHLRWRFRTALAAPYGAPLAEMEQATVNLAGRMSVVTQFDVLFFTNGDGWRR